MSFDWVGLGALAASLKADGDGHAASDPALAQGAWRASVSRAYYCAYHQVLARHVAYWSAVPFNRPNQGSHKDLLDSLIHKEPTVQGARERLAVKTIHNELGRLLELRHAADYRETHTFSSQKVGRAIERLRKIEGELQHLVRPPPSSTTP